MICNIAKCSESHIPAAAAYVNNLNSTFDTYATVAGISLNGVPWLTAVSTNEVDPYYPADWSGATTGWQAEKVDACIGHPGASANYHYHMLPPCLVYT